MAPIPASGIACTAVPSAPLLNKCTQGAQVHLRPPSVHSHRGESARSAYAPAFRLMPEGTIVYLRNSERKYPYVGGLGVCPLRNSERKKTLPGARLCDPTRHFCLRHNPLQGHLVWEAWARAPGTSFRETQSARILTCPSCRAHVPQSSTGPLGSTPVEISGGLRPRERNRFVLTRGL